jgi:17beta-estradiol 17-dehydrogenase / very-long-chain 3-oxoacyl-CoA reductase
MPRYFYYVYEIKFWLYLILCYYVYKFLRFLYRNLIRKRHNLQDRYGENSWALVTGATDGIGKAICLDLARSGFNIILVSRNLDKLNKVATEIQKVKSTIQTHVIAFDFNLKNKLEDYVEAFENLQEKFDISILVNNVGTDQHNTFERVKLDLIYSSININIIPQTILTRLFINKFNRRFDRSAIINLSSYAGEYPFPMKALYAATKIYNHYLSVGLMEETKEYLKIDWLSVKPLEVETILSTTKADGFLVITPSQCAKAILDDLGYEGETYTHIAHKIQAYLVNLVPKCILYEVYRRFWFKWFIDRDEKTE